ncbi:MAG: primosomal protein N' [Tissierellia bacterium]|nr:primosomal protein N' [Tissierellia bacterium]
MDKKYAKVIIDNRAHSTDKPYTYLIKPEMIDILEIGMRVLVPFGMGNRKIIGIVIETCDSYEGNYKLKSIIDILDDKPLIGKDLIDLSMWMSEEYLSPYLDSLQTVLPPGNFKEVKSYISIGEEYGCYKGELNSFEKDILDFILNQEKEIDLDLIRENFKDKNLIKTIKYLENLNLINSSLKVETTIEKKYEKYISLVYEDLSYKEIVEKLGKRSYKQIEIVDYLMGLEPIPLKTLMKTTNASLSTIKTVEKKGLIEIFEREIYREPIKTYIKPYEKHKLTKEQGNALGIILNNIRNQSSQNKFLIHGVTGSGKTEIYLQLVEEMLNLNKDSIVLVPEISLTPQTVERFVGRFGDNVAILHSRLSYGERFDQWRKIKEGKVKIVVGARSAVFAPFNNLGLIIIDEEHESTYKSGMNPKYSAIEVAEKRCEQLGAYLVKGSATPSLESYYKAKSENIKLINLKERVNNKALPEVKVIDMREELNNGNTSIFSEELYYSIDKNLKENKQTILFLNRRGYSTFVSCRQCGYVVKCNSCDISMTYYMTENKLKCHYCGLAINPPNLCPICKSKYIKYFGIGTEKVEDYTKKLFPKARVERMDMDTTSKKGSHETILQNMKDEKIDILIGTQMIGKGLDFKNVTLVGIIAADTSLNLPDFRASERTFQLVTQVAGRAGRGDFPGKVIVQSYNPDHYSIQASKEHDYIGFYNKEILLRKEFNYPPFTNIISITIYGENRNRVIKASQDIYSALIEKININRLEKIQDNIIGPSPAALEKIKNNFRYQILIKSPDECMKKLKEIIEWVCIINRDKLDLTDIKLNIDINSNSIL